MSQKLPGSLKKHAILTHQIISDRLTLLWPNGEVTLKELLPSVPGQKKRRAIFIDKDAGEWEAAIGNILMQNQRHPSTRAARGTSKLIKPIAEVEAELEIIHKGLVKIKPETYVKSGSVATFVDIEFGEWRAPVYSVLQNHGHPTRYKKDHVKWYIDDETVFEICKYSGIPYYDAKYVISRYGVPNSVAELLSSMDAVKNGNDNGLERSVEKDFPMLERWDKEVLKTRRFRPDFKIKDTNIFVNIDGLFWHCEERTKTAEHHYEMKKLYQQEGYDLITFYEDEITQKFDIVLSILKNKAGQSKRTHTRKCELRQITPEVARKFFEQNHLMGYYGGNGLGLYFQETLVAAMTFIKRPEATEIARFATRQGYSVPGAFSKFVSKIEGNVYSFCDLRYGNGISYEKAGFTVANESVSFCWTDGKRRFHRLQCKATETQTQKEVAKEKKLFRLFDYGQRKYVLNRT